jgi:hypothetical protein
MKIYFKNKSLLNILILNIKNGKDTKVRNQHLMYK